MLDIVLFEGTPTTRIKPYNIRSSNARIGGWCGAKYLLMVTYHQLYQIDQRQSRSKKHPNPYEPLIVHQAKDVLGNIEVGIFREGLLKIPTPAGVHVTDKEGAARV